jgi:hypothetical protein
MKTITVNVSEPVYRAYQQFARTHDRTSSELIREAMADYQEKLMRTGQSIRNMPPLSLGEVLRPLSASDDILEEMSHG